MYLEVLVNCKKVAGFIQLVKHHEVCSKNVISSEHMGTKSHQKLTYRVSSSAPHAECSSSIRIFIKVKINVSLPSLSQQLQCKTAPHYLS